MRNAKKQTKHQKSTQTKQMRKISLLFTANSKAEQGVHRKPRYQISQQGMRQGRAVVDDLGKCRRETRNRKQVNDSKVHKRRFFTSN